MGTRAGGDSDLLDPLTFARNDMRTLRTVTIIGFVALGMGGCVTKAKHADLQRELDATTKQLSAERDGRADDKAASMKQLQALTKQSADLGDALEEERTRADAYGRQIAGLQGMLANKQQEIATLEGKVARTEEELAAVIKRRAALKTSLDKISEALSDLSRRKLAAERRVAEYQDMLGRFAKLIDAGKLQIRIVDGRMVLTLPMDILFASGKTDLTKEGKASLLEVGAGLATIADRRFQIEGHTDTVPIHTTRFPSNWELGAGRALVVVHTLLEAGVAATSLSAASYGEHHPRGTNDNDDGRAANRRIEIVVVPDLSDLPGYDELNALDGGKRD